ncbi:MAG: TatD family hydrolase [Puniceicoccales bacterium]|jgi:TatD DNase family protein|nr:TatD family hydrolase [Puniceicoccales bacterium]
MDSHVHLDYFPEERRGEIIARAWRAGLQVLVTIAVTLGSAGVLSELAKRFLGRIFYSVGVHPTELGATAVENLGSALESVLGSASPAAIAVGEMGLDYASLPKDAAEARKIVAAQRVAFREQAAAAKNAHLPLVIHCRDVEGQRTAWEDTNGILDGLSFDRSRALMHCFSYGSKELCHWQGRGGCVSFSGILTRKKAVGVHGALLAADLSRVLFETDAPFLLPEPLRTESPRAENEPANAILVSDFAANLLERSGREMAELGLANGLRFFSVEMPPC